MKLIVPKKSQTTYIIYQNKQSELQRESLVEWASQQETVTPPFLHHIELETMPTERRELDMKNTSNQPMTKSLLGLIGFDLWNVPRAKGKSLLFNSKPTGAPNRHHRPYLGIPPKKNVYDIQNTEKGKHMGKTPKTGSNNSAAFSWVGIPFP